MKNHKTFTYILFLNAILFLIPYSSSHSLEDAIKSKDRSSKNVMRDRYRNPYETLSFFEIEQNMKVVELSPGGGWYTEILANYIHSPGEIIAAHFDKNSNRDFYVRMRKNFENKVNENPLYKNVSVVDLSSKLAEPGTVDAVLTFRNLHNWIGPQIDLIFSNAHKALKKGGILGVVEHRANPGTSLEEMKRTGYVTEEYAIKIAEKHGFTLISKSEINSNPKDTKDYVRGVWTLPPVLRLKEKDKQKYLDIGESDRMTILFKKL
tara:strand:+ start:3880 stop:4671 length:792 start_codon:yes stop_codon:yes gene_type:complete